MNNKTTPTTAPAFLVHKVVCKGETPVWTTMDTDKTLQEEAYDGPERRSGAERRTGNMANGKFGNIERRVTMPFGRRRSDRTV